MNHRQPQYPNVMSIMSDIEREQCPVCTAAEDCADGWCGAMPALARQRSCPAGFMRYVIKRGESLITIARNHNISLALLLQYNPDINPYFYRAGEELCVPETTGYCSGGRLYSVKNGDTLASIAIAFGITLERLTKANPYVNPANLLPGQVICVPAEEEATPPPATPEPTPAPEVECPENYSTYIMREEDTFVTVLMNFDVSYAALTQANPAVTLETAMAGQMLCVPPAGTNGSCEDGGSTYIVRQGQTPLTISQALNVSLASLLKANPLLAPSDFVAGRFICLPAN